MATASARAATADTETGVAANDTVTVTLELDSGYRSVDMPSELNDALKTHKLTDVFKDLSYSKRKEYARQVTDAKAPDTKHRRLEKIITELKGE
jgi:uncharacterized protein YdeI (YjbR/CyaY-like superfamily)